MKQIERIKNMTTSEMAEYLESLNDCRSCRRCYAKEYCCINYDGEETCKQTIKDFLESEVTTCESNNTQTE
ncbi:MAG: hypothetical protein K0R18_2000 [Bacillales bacterium]|jgi:hypothetical protein|nr:hypothetical protein [Bacillales bacterium]